MQTATNQQSSAQTAIYSEFNVGHVIDRYDPEDFAKHPAKYELFRTACIAVRPLQLAKNLRFQKVGEIVAIKYMNTYPSGVDGKLEPYYEINSDGYLSAAYLGDFHL